MSEENQEETYRGHRLEVTAYELRRGLWAWGYLIDGKVDGRNRPGTELPDAQAALRRGVLAARARSDELGAKTSGKPDWS